MRSTSIRKQYNKPNYLLIYQLREVLSMGQLLTEEPVNRATILNVFR